VLLRVAHGTASEVIARLNAHGGDRVRRLAPDLVTANLPASSLQAVALDDDIVRMSLDAKVKTLDNKWLHENTLLETQGLLKRKSNGEAERRSKYTGKDVVVVLIDSGLTPNGDLDDVKFYDFTQGGEKARAYDDYGHGTHVAGLIGSGGKLSSSRYAGFAPGCKYVVLKALDEDGNGYTSDVIAAINFAVDNRTELKTDIINLSLGHPIYEPAASDPLVQAVERAVAAGIVVVASAGNFGGDIDTHEPEYAGITSPGNAPSAISVGAVDTRDTASRGDDVVAWYSSRGPTWYDGFQKPDLVAPGSRLVSNVSEDSTLYSTYRGGLITVKDKAFIRLSGTSMAAGVVTGIVATVLEANREVFDDARKAGFALTPNAVKAILQYTALVMPAEDILSQGAGSANATGAIALAELIDPSAPIGSPWLTSGIQPFTEIAGTPLAWGQRVVWGDRVIWGHQTLSNDPAWALRVVWGDRLVWGNRIVWGQSTVWDGNQTIWGNRVVWGNALIGQTDGSSVIWGVLDEATTANRVVWGNLDSLAIAPTSLSWGNMERANEELMPESVRKERKETEKFKKIKRARRKK
jgi:serine protease AprX